MSKKLGDMTPAERDAVIARALNQLQQELTAAAPAIGRVLDEVEAADAQTGL